MHRVLDIGFRTVPKPYLGAEHARCPHASYTPPGESKASKACLPAWRAPGRPASPPHDIQARSVHDARRTSPVPRHARKRKDTPWHQGPGRGGKARSRGASRRGDLVRAAPSRTKKNAGARPFRQGAGIKPRMGRFWQRARGLCGTPRARRALVRGDVATLRPGGVRAIVCARGSGRAGTSGNGRAGETSAWFLTTILRD